MRKLAKAFQPLTQYQAPASETYQLLPFRFLPLTADKCFLSNEVGEYVILPRTDLQDLIDQKLHPGTELYNNLKARHFLIDSVSDAAIDLLALKYRTRVSNLGQFTSLHLFVVSLRCDYSCPYCQVSRQTEEKSRFDMSEDTAMRSLELVFRSPSPAIKIEFQGGEPLLNFGLIRTIVHGAERINESQQRDLQFVIATNLSHLNQEILEFCQRHDIYISTSLDGPQDLHDGNRPRPGQNGYELTAKGIGAVQRTLGTDKISAVMTTTELSLTRVRDIIDEYVRWGFRSVFLRPLSPYGFAVKTRQVEKYDMDRWLEFYKEGLDYILELNCSGRQMIEYYTSLLLQRLLTHQPTRYVDLRSPAGIGIAALVYNYDGDVYASDEARMLAEMGDKSFRLGNVHSDTYEDIMLSDNLLEPLELSITESVPMCTDCAFQPYCGSDPVYHHATQRDPIGHKAFSGFCQRSMGMMGHLVGILEQGGQHAKILRGWVGR